MIDLPSLIIDGGEDATPITVIRPEDLPEWKRGEDHAAVAWIDANGFTAKPRSLCLLPGADGSLARVLFGRDDEWGVWSVADLPTRLPGGRYRLDPAPDDPAAAARVVLGWVLGAYRFARYRKPEAGESAPGLVLPDGVDGERVAAQARAVLLGRDLINTPAEDLGPAEIAEAARHLADQFGAKFDEIVGDALLARNYPAVHAVGRASTRAPRLIDLTWGEPDAPKVTLVGKGVCFDTGGLDLKPRSAMGLMKKDMGGAAHVLALARMIMAAGLPVRLRVLIPAVENSVSGNALRPGDVIATRKGLWVEIGDTDAEGRVILADALAEADREQPELLIDVATLTGAARAAVGTEIAAYFADDDALAQALDAAGAAESDPVWRMPLYQPYRKLLDSKVADISNIGGGPYAGAITAALFLREFVSQAQSWLHFDLMAYNVRALPGRPEGGEVMGMRALFQAIAERFPHR